MASSKETVGSVLASLGSPRFSTRAMFGEYAVYADGRVVALVCNDRLYVKIHPATAGLADDCETAAPYPGAKAHHVLDEGQWASRQDLPQVLLQLANDLPPPKGKSTKSTKARAKGTTAKAR